MFIPRMGALSAALGCALVIQGACADSPADSSNLNGDALNAGALNPVVVTATRTAQPLDKTGSAMSVISGADIDTQQQSFVSDALAQTAGLSVTRNGGPGQSTSLFIRGAEAGESLLLVDGIRINDPSAPDGAALLGDLLVNNISRIEVLRGPQSTLYGSDAIGGVVNVLTQRGGTQPFQGALEGEGGTYGTYRLNGAAHGTVGSLDYGGALNYYDTRGISAACVCDGNSEPDGYRDFGATANLRFRASDTLSIDLRGFYTRSHTDIDGFPPPNFSFADDPEFGRSQLLAGYAAVTESLLDGRVTQRVALVGRDSDRRFYGVFGDAPPFAFTPARNFLAQGGATRAEYQGIIEAGANNEVTYGAETQLSTIRTASIFDLSPTPTTGRDRLSGYYGQWQSTIARQLTLTGGVRYDDDREFGGHSSYKLAAAWQLGASTLLRANFGNGYKAPTLYQQFSAFSNPFGPLQAEKAAGWEAGLDQDFLDKRVRASLTYFNRNEHDLIEFDSCFPNFDAGCATRPQGYYFNVDHAHVHGVEAALVARPASGWSAWLNYTNLRAIDELSGLNLQRRPHITANAGLTWSSPRGSSLGASYGYTGARFDDAGNNTPLPAGENVSLYGSYALGPHLQLLARIDNLFNNRSEPLAGFGTTGEAIYAGVRLSL
jgi:vitamin B12 transporter